MRGTKKAAWREYRQARARLGFRDCAVLADFEQHNPVGKIEICAADDEKDTAEIRIYEEIGLDWWTGEGVTPSSIARQLDEIKASSIRVRINSPGGSVFDGFAIYSLLAERDEEVTVTIDGIAASAASIIAMSGDVIEAQGNSQMMIHSAWTIAAGNANDMREMADVLERIDGQIADTYAARSGTDRSEFVEMLGTDTYLTADEAKDLGLVDRVIELKGKPDSEGGGSGAADNSASRRFAAYAVRNRQALVRAAWKRRRA